MIDYSVLWETMERKGISQYYLMQHGIAGKTIYNMKRNRHISTATLEKLCNLLACTPNEIIRFL